VSAATTFIASNALSVENGSGASLPPVSARSTAPTADHVEGEANRMGGRHAAGRYSERRPAQSQVDADEPQPPAR